MKRSPIKSSNPSIILQAGTVDGVVGGDHHQHIHLNPCCRARLSKVKVAPVGRLKPMSLFVVEYRGFSSFAACLKVNSSVSRASLSSGARRYKLRGHRKQNQKGAGRDRPGRTGHRSVWRVVHKQKHIQRTREIAVVLERCAAIALFA